MRINNVVRFTSGNVGRCVAFGKRPKEENERNDLRETSLKALDYLGVQKLGLIMHGTSSPRGKYDQKTGTPYGQKEFIDEIGMYGINQQQLGPMGKLNRGENHSPYASSIFAKEPLYINLESLTDKEYAGILKKQSLNMLLNKTAGETVRTDYTAAEEISQKLLNAAYTNFQKKLSQGNKDAIRLNSEFLNFMAENKDWLDTYAVIDALAEKNGTDYTPNWSKEDRELLENYKKADLDAVKRWNGIEEENSENIEKYKFFQFLIDKQSREDKKQRSGFEFSGDLEVGMSNLDEYIYQDVFLPGWKMGCKYGGPKNSQQLWGAPVLDPNKLFNEDGSLGASGLFLKNKLKGAIASSENIRIDHVMGLVNPYIYKADDVQYVTEKDDNGVEITYPKRGSFEADYMVNTKVDPDGNFKRVLSEIVLPTMKEMGVNPDNVVWEDLGDDETGVFWKVFNDELGLKGISGLQWVAPTEMDADKYAYYASHDDQPTLEMIKNKRDMDNTPMHWQSNFLATELRKDTYKKYERAVLEEEIIKSDVERMHAMYALLFKEGKKIQIPFTDMFGISEPYNVPGTTGDKNWTLGLGSNWKDVYYKNLSKGDDARALNIPAALKKAVQAKVDEDVSVKHKPYQQTMDEAKPILDKLTYWENYLKETEE